MKRINTILSRVFGILLLISGLGLSTSELQAGIILLITGLIIFPPINKIIQKKVNFHISGRTKVIIVILGIIISGIITTNDPIGKQDQKTEEKKTEMSSLEQMSIAFIGNHTESQIKEKLDRAMILYGLEINNENYSRAGSTLISLRKTSKKGITEMEILNNMINIYEVGTSIDFPNIAAIAYTDLETQ